MLWGLQFHFYVKETRKGRKEGTEGTERTFTLVLPPTLPVSKRNIYNGLGWLLQWVKELLHGPGPELRTMRSRNPGLQEPNLSIFTGSPKIHAILFLS